MRRVTQGTAKYCTGYVCDSDLQTRHRYAYNTPISGALVPILGNQPVGLLRPSAPKLVDDGLNFLASQLVQDWGKDSPRCDELIGSHEEVVVACATREDDKKGGSFYLDY